jgi:hypothetical protein
MGQPSGGFRNHLRLELCGLVLIQLAPREGLLDLPQPPHTRLRAVQLTIGLFGDLLGDPDREAQRRYPAAAPAP